MFRGLPVYKILDFSGWFTFPSTLALCNAFFSYKALKERQIHLYLYGSQLSYPYLKSSGYSIIAL
jgi:hypothetical protein